MGLEQPTMSWRPNLENALFIEGIHRNWFPFLSRNAFMNVLVNWVRLYSTAENINFPQDVAQRVLSISLYTSESKVPAIGPQKSVEQQNRRRA